MEYTVQKTRELEGLRELRRNRMRLNDLEKEKNALLGRRGIIVRSIENSWQGVVNLLPTDNGVAYKMELDDKIHAETVRKKRWTRFLLVGSIALLGLLAILHYVLCILSIGEEVVVQIVVNMVYYTVAVALYAAVGFSWLGKGLISRFFFLCFGCFAPFSGLCLTTVVMLAIHPILTAIPIAMIVLLIITRIVLNREFAFRGYTEEEKQILKNKTWLDSSNECKNQENIDAARRQARKSMEGKLTEVNQEIQACEANIGMLQQKINHNGYLSEKDINFVDDILEYMETGRADSVKEALRILDDKLDKQEREKREISRRNAERFLAEQRWLREQEKQERDRQNWENEERWRQNREYERREEHRKNVEDELREIRKQLED